MSESAFYPLPLPLDSAPPPRAQRRPISDVRLFHAADGGEISFVGGALVMCDGLEPAVYLSLFGGNEEDSGLPSDLSRQWWGNFSEPDPLKHYRSETAFLLATLPATTGNARRIESAALHDVEWMITAGIARATSAVVTLPARNAITIAISIELASGEEERFDFPRSWGTKT